MTEQATVDNKQSNEQEPLIYPVKVATPDDDYPIEEPDALIESTNLNSDYDIDTCLLL